MHRSLYFERFPLFRHSLHLNRIKHFSYVTHHGIVHKKISNTAFYCSLQWNKLNQAADTFIISLISTVSLSPSFCLLFIIIIFQIKYLISSSDFVDELIMLFVLAGNECKLARPFYRNSFWTYLQRVSDINSILIMLPHYLQQ